MRALTVSLVVASLASVGGATLAQESGPFDGFYVGGHVGIADHTMSLSDFDYRWYGGTLDLRTDGVVYGLQVGRNWQTGSTVLGIEFDYGVASLSESFDHSLTADQEYVIRGESELNALASLRFRGGLAIDRTLLYFTGGAALIDVDGSWIARPGGPDSWPDLGGSESGWTFGAGFEHRVAESSLSWRIEALWGIFGDYEVFSPDSVRPRRVVGNEALQLRFGVSYMF